MMTEYQIQRVLARRLFGKRILEGHIVNEVLLRNITLNSATGGAYEADFLRIIRGPVTGKLMEVEIKTSVEDFRRDRLKKRFHDNEYVKAFYYAIPVSVYRKADAEVEEWLTKAKAGLILIDDDLTPHIAKKAPPFRKEVSDMPTAAYIKLLEKGTMKWWCEDTSGVIRF